MIIEKIKSLGINLDSYEPGEHKSTCPWCSHSRKKKNLKCLSVKIDGKNFVYICHHCGAKGGQNDEPTNTRADHRIKGTRRRDAGKLWRNSIQTAWY